jgi:hypothetical protein
LSGARLEGAERSIAPDWNFRADGAHSWASLDGFTSRTGSTSTVIADNSPVSTPLHFGADHGTGHSFPRTTLSEKVPRRGQDCAKKR